MFNIQEISAELARSGVQRDDLFEVTLNMPPGFLKYQVHGAQEFMRTASVLRLYCEQAALPGVALMTGEYRRYGYGVAQKKPFVPQFGDLNLMFRCDATGSSVPGGIESGSRGDQPGKVHAFLTSWLRMAVCFEQRGDLGMRAATGSVPSQRPYEVAYQEDYVQDVFITAYAQNGKPTVSIVLEEAYPTYVGEIPLNWGATGSYARLPVVLSYTSWYSRRPNAVGAANIVT